MLGVRNLHTFVPNESGTPTLFAVDAAGTIDPDAATHWGVYQGDPATKVSGNMDVWDPGGDPEEGPDPYTESWVKTTGCQVWYAAGDGNWYAGKTVQVGLIYGGDDIGEVSVDISGGYQGDGYYAIFVTYPPKSPAPQVVWLVGAAYTPPSAEPFWTNLINCRELSAGAGSGSGSGSGGGVAPGAGGGDSPGTAIVITGAPYSATLGQISKSAVLWFKVTLAAGTYRFHTADSPQPTDHDTHLALFDASGAVVAENDDIDLDGGDYRSSVTETLAAGTYYVALSSRSSTAGAGFSLVLAGEYDVPAGTILKIEAV